MFSTDISVCNDRIEQEQRLADAAPSLEAGLVHHQMVMLYKAELSLLYRKQFAHQSSLAA